MAATKKPVELEDELTFVHEEKEEGPKGPTVQIYLPKLEEEGGGVKVDQYEHVTIANEVGEPKTWFIKRGERVDIPVKVYLIMKEKYPDL
jgi:hypothetical protein